MHPIDRRLQTLHLALGLLVTAAVACTCLPSAGLTPTATQAPPPPTVARPTPVPPTRLPTSVPTSVPTQPPPLPGPSPSPVEIAGPFVSFNGVSFILDPAIAHSVYAQIPSEPGDIAGWTGFRLSLEGWRCDAGCVSIFPVAFFQDPDRPNGDVLPRLEAALEQPSTSDFPLWGAGILVQAQTQLLDFASGHGIRSLVTAGQDFYWVSNESLEYMFLGKTADGEYVVSVQLPIRAPFLLDGRDPQTNTNPDAMPLPELPSDWALWDQAVMGYNREAERQLEGLAPAGFTPDLRLLDALIGSLQISDDYQQFPAPTEEPG